MLFTVQKRQLISNATYYILVSLPRYMQTPLSGRCVKVDRCENDTGKSNLYILCF